jgi:hypothetical protein
MSSAKPPVLIEGYTTDEILQMPDEWMDNAILTGESWVFKVGTAEILGAFEITGKRLIIELAQIEGGGEGILPAFWILARRYAHQRDLQEIEWVVHAINCAQPNIKLRRLLERRGFVVEQVPGKGMAFHFTDSIFEDMQSDDPGMTKPGKSHD